MGGHERTLRLDLTYAGFHFAGWQRQPDQRTVQGVLEEALARALNQPHGVIGCGRTDAGTHAHHHVASLRTSHDMPARELHRALNALLPDDLAVLAVNEAAPGFHAQRDAVWKWYRYRILVSGQRLPLVGERFWRRRRVPSINELQAAADVLLGTHDFASFANAGSQPSSTVRTLFALRWREGHSGAGENLPGLEIGGGRGAKWLALDAIGDGFLYKMVRTIVGTCLRAAEEEEAGPHMREVLTARDRRAAAQAVPATGLTLMAVHTAEQALNPASMPRDLWDAVAAHAAVSPEGRTA